MMVRFLLFTLLAVGIFFVTSDSALAQQEAACSEMPAFASANNFADNTLNGVLREIERILAITGGEMYKTIIKNDVYQNVVGGLFILSIAMFGAMIVLDMVRLTPGVIISKLVTLGLVAWLLSPNGGWDFFGATVVPFFKGGMDDLISIFTLEALKITHPGANISETQAANPLWVLNQPFGLLVSTHFFILIIGCLFTGPYGWIIAIILVWAGFNMLMAVLSAVFIYIKSVVGLWFLFGLAPIFIIMMLFKRTFSIFEGWLNMVVYLSILPVMTFAFITFFMVIVMGSLSMVMQTKWCWCVFGLFTGTPFNAYWWRAAREGTSECDGVWNMMGYEGAGDPQGLVFPLGFIDVLFFLLASYIAWQYAQMVSQIARELAGGSVNLGSEAASVRSWFETRGWTPGQAATRGASNIASRIPNLGALGRNRLPSRNLDLDDSN